MTDPLQPGATIGILGGGQLGRMLSVAASRLGYRSHIYEPGAAPAADVAHASTTAAWDDAAALTAFAKAVDVVTYEFENVPAQSLDLIESIVPIHPGRRALAISQDRCDEKTFLEGIGLHVAPWAQIDGARDLEAAIGRQRAGILKTRRLGYDGKGQIRLAPGDDATAAWGKVDVPAVYESLIAFECEISVIVARAIDGQVAAFDPGRNLHKGGILRTTTIPCGLPVSVTAEAVLIAGKIAQALDYVGVMGVELFVTKSGLLVNEIAPRVHNSGHWTQAGCSVDQFEQHIRAVAGLPLGDGQRYADVVMENLIGDDMARLPALLHDGNCQINLYGKADVRTGRKMGHVNRVIR